jgi:hypothetical protein
MFVYFYCKKLTYPKKHQQISCRKMPDPCSWEDTTFIWNKYGKD